MACRRAAYLTSDAAYTAHDVATAFDRGYQAGLAEGQRRRAQELPLATWKQLASLVHPDRYQDLQEGSCDET